MKKPARFLLILTGAAMALSLSAEAFAQATPSTAEPARVRKQIAPVTEMPMIEAPVAGSGAGAVNAPAGADKVRLTLKSVSVDGNTVYGAAELAGMYKDQIGQSITLADVYALAQKMTAKYRNDGYILTQVVVPPQTIDGGNIRLRVVEGFVENVSLQGASERETAYFQQYLEKIRAARPLNARALERYLLLMNDLAGVSARAVLSPSKTTGASDVTIVIEKKAYDVFMQADNRGSRFLGAFQMNAGARLNGPFGFHEGLTFQAVTAPDGWPSRELDFASVSWAQPLNHEGTTLTVGTSLTSTEPGYTLSQFAITSRARAVNLDLSHPFIRARQENLTGSFKFDYLNSRRTDNLGVGPTEDRLRVLRAGATYQFADGWLGMNTLNAEASRGIDVINMKGKGTLNPTRALGDPEFFKMTAEVSRLQRLTGQLEMFLSTAGQKSANMLLASEEFGVGGTSYGSAYDSSEITGEDGFSSRAELRYNNPFPGVDVDQMQFYGFYDVGVVWDRDGGPGQRVNSLASGGAGLRLTLNDKLSGGIEVAVPLTRPAQATADNAPRIFGAVTARF